MDETKQIIEKASEAFSNKEFNKAISLLKPLIDAGNAAATGMMGLAYQYGSGVEKNGHKAIELLQKAVELGDVYAAHNLGRLYMHGTDDVEADNGLSNVYYSLAKEMGIKYETESE